MTARRWSKGTSHENNPRILRSDRMEGEAHLQRDHPKRRWSDRRRINLLDPYERHYWTKFFGIDEADLLQAIDSVGTYAEDVRGYLAAERQRDWVFGGRENRRQVPGRPQAS